jgi:hypothetical protein
MAASGSSASNDPALTLLPSSSTGDVAGMMQFTPSSVQNDAKA